MLKMELFLYQDNTSLFLRLLANYVNAEKKNIIKILSIKDSTRKLLNLPEEPFLVTSKNETVNDEILISQIIANFSGRSEDLFGSDLERVETNVNFIKNSKKKCEEPLKFLEHLNSHLLYNTFVNGFHITISDIYAFSQIIKFLGGLNDAEKNKFTNILRWVNHLQTLEILKDSIKELQLNISIPFEPLVFLKEDPEPKCSFKKERNYNKEQNPNANANAEKKPVEAKEQIIQEEKKQPEQNQNGKKEGEERPKKEKVPQTSEPKKAKAPAAKKEEADDVHSISKLDVRVGRVINIFENKDSEKLYNEEIDIGNGEIRKIASGLKGRVPMEDLKDSLVVVLCNLKERTLCGWPSHGMLLCATNDQGTTQPIRPPVGSNPGDSITFGTYPRLPVAELHPKKNPWDNVKDELFIDENKQAAYAKSHFFTTPNGVVTVKSLTKAKIS